MKNKRLAKGEYGYLPQEKKRAVLVTALMLGMALAVYLVGYVSTGTNQNLLTIVAVLGCLPGCKSAVRMIMLLRTRPCPPEIYAEASKRCQKGLSLFELELTSYETTFELWHMASVGETLIGYSAHPKCVPAKCETHIADMLRQNGLKEIRVKIFTDWNHYVSRLEQLQQQEESEKQEKQEKLRSLLCAISL